jgi:hypothetical protein
LNFMNNPMKHKNKKEQCKCHCHAEMKHGSPFSQPCPVEECSHCQSPKGQEWENEIKYILDKNGGSNYVKNIQYSDSKYPNRPTEEVLIIVIRSLLSRQLQEVRRKIKKLKTHDYEYNEKAQDVFNKILQALEEKE